MGYREQLEHVHDSGTLKDHRYRHIHQIKHRKIQCALAVFAAADIVNKEVKGYREKVKCKQIHIVQGSSIRDQKLKKSSLLQGPQCNLYRKDYQVQEDLIFPFYFGFSFAFYCKKIEQQTYQSCE